MTLLGLEFSSPQRSVALLRDDTRAETMETGGRHAAALGMIQNVLAQTAIPRAEVDTLVIGLGPGSYTGIRAAIALAQGWQLASGARLLGANSIEAIVAGAHAANVNGRIAVAIDAQRAEFYLATFDLTSAGWIAVEPLQIVPMIEVQARSAANHLIVGPEVHRWFPDGRQFFPTAAMLAWLSRNRTDFVSGDHLKPIYLRETTFVKAPSNRVIGPPP